MFNSLFQIKVYFGFVLLALIMFFYGYSSPEKTNNTNIINTYGAVSEITTQPVDTFILPANPGPANNGGSAGWAMFFNLIAGPRNITVTQMSTASNAAASGSFSVEVYTRSGNALGGPVNSGPGSSPDGWTLRGTVPVTQGSTSNGISLIFNLPEILITAGDTVGVALKFLVVGPRYFGTGSPPYSAYADTNLTLITGDARSAPFTPTGSWFASRALCGEIRYVISTATVVGNTKKEIPNAFKLEQNYPNPFNPTTKIRFDIMKLSIDNQNPFVTLKVFDIMGREIATLVNKSLQPGSYEVLFDGSSFNSGIYFYRLFVGDYSDTRQMILLK